MEPQVSVATGASSFTILKRFTDEWGTNKAVVQGNYGTSRMEILGPHNACEFNGEIVVSYDEWATNYYCCGCNYSEYHPLGD